VVELGKLRKAFDSLIYSISILMGLFLVAMVFGIQGMFAGLFSPTGLVLTFFIVFGTISD